MGNELVINTTSQETRIALIENGNIAELYIERRIGDQVRRFQVPFRLNTSSNTRRCG